MPSTVQADRERELAETLQQIIQQLARHEITEEEARKKLEAYWEVAHHQPWLLRVLRELLPSLSRTA